MVNLLRPLVGRRSKLDLRNKILLFQTVIAPTMLYEIAAWGHAANRKKIQIVQNKALRTIMDAPWIVKTLPTEKT